MARFLCTVEYGQPGHEVLVEVWLQNDAPPGATDRSEVEEVLRMVAHGTVPEGWTVSAMTWQHPRGGGKGLSGMDSARLEAFSSLINSSEVHVEDDDGRRKPGTPRRQTDEDE